MKTKEKLFAKNVGYEPIGAFKRNEPFVIAFVYPRNERPFIIKGGSKKVATQIQQFRTLGMKALIWNLEYVKQRNGKKKVINAYGVVVGLPEEYFIYTRRIKNFNMPAEHFGVNKNHKWVLQVMKEEEIIMMDGTTGKSPNTIFVKSFKNQPRCFPKCLEQFIPEAEKNQKMQNQVVIH